MTVDIFRVYAYDLNTNTKITELPAKGLTFDGRLNDSGSISFVLNLSRPEVASRVAPLLPYNGSPFAVYVDRDGLLVWSGIIWTWNYSRASGDLSMQGKDFNSYFAQRKLAADYSNATYPFTRLTAYAASPVSSLTVESTTGFAAGQKVTLGSDSPEVLTILSVTAPYTITLVSPTVVNHPATSPLTFSFDPAVLLKLALSDVLSNTVGGAGSNILGQPAATGGITIVGGTSTIPAIVPGYPLSQNTKASQVISDMASISSPGNGSVDTTITSAWVGGLPVTTLTIASPRAGRVGAASGLIIDLSRVLDYSWPLNSNATGTLLTVTGGNSLVKTLSTGVAVGGNGQLPKLDKVISFSSIQSQSQLDVMAAGLPQVYSGPLGTPTVKLTTTGLPQLGTFVLGDDVRMFIAKDERFPLGLDEYWRIVQYSVSVPDEGVPTISFTLNKPPVY